VQTGPGNGTTPLVTTISLPVTIVAGSPLAAQFFVHFGCGPGQTDAASHVVAHYGVSGLPEGVEAVNCVAARVTPARAESWGTLKAHYR